MAMALASNVSERHAAAASAPLTKEVAANSARQRAPHQSITMRCKNLEDNLVRNREMMEEHHDFAQRFKAMKGSPQEGGEMPQQGQASGGSMQQTGTPRGESGGFGSAQATMREADQEKRHHILFGAPGGHATALANYRPASLATTPRNAASNFSSPPLSHRTDGSNSARMRLQQAGNMIGIGGGTHSDTGGDNTGSGQRWTMKGSLQLRLEAMQMNAQRNAEQLDSQRSFLDEINAIRNANKERVRSSSKEAA